MGSYLETRSESGTHRRTAVAAEERAGICRGGSEAAGEGKRRDGEIPARAVSEGCGAGIDRRGHSRSGRRRGDGSHQLRDRGGRDFARVRFDGRDFVGAEFLVLRPDSSFRYRRAEEKIPVAVRARRKDWMLCPYRAAGWIERGGARDQG